MRKLISIIADAPYRLLAAATVSLMALESQARATTLGDMANSVDTSMQSMGKMVLGGSMVAGLGLSGAGLLKLKAAADTQGQQVKYSEGMWRLAVGAGLVALPSVITTMQATGSVTGSGAVTEGSVTIN